MPISGGSTLKVFLGRSSWVEENRENKSIVLFIPKSG